MYIWNYKKLAEDLRDGKVTQRERFKYFFFISIMGIIATESAIYSIRDLSIEHIAGSLFRIVGFLIALWIVYNKNKIGDDKDFIERYVCLNFPITIQVTVYSIIATYTWLFVSSVVFKDVFEVYAGFAWYVQEMISIILFVVVAHYWIYRSIDIITKK